MLTLEPSENPKLHVLMVGSVSDGYAIYGPFGSYTEAYGYLCRACAGNTPTRSGDHSQIVPLEAPPPAALGKIELI